MSDPVKGQQQRIGPIIPKSLEDRAWKFWMENHLNVVDALAGFAVNETATLRACLAECVEALRPFSHLGMYVEDYPDDYVLGYTSDVGEIRHALAALTHAKQLIGDKQ